MKKSLLVLFVKTTQGTIHFSFRVSLSRQLVIWEVTTCGLYEPIHGSAPDIAGQDKANPVGTILSAAMMLRFSFDMKDEADAIERAVSDYLDAGYRTADIMSEGGILVGCTECGRIIAENIKV